MMDEKNTTQSKKGDFLEVSVVLPCLNEEKTIGICIQKALETLRKLNILGEVVVSDNGSTDNSVTIARSLGARVVFQPRRGYGNAYLKGIEEAKGKYIIIADSDNTYDLSDLEKFITPLRKDYDMVMGTRLKGTIMPSAMPWLHKYIGNPFLSWFLNKLFKTGISDAHCGMRSFTKEAFHKMNLKTPGMEFASEMVINASKSKLRMYEVPITLYANKERTPHLRTFRDGWRHLCFMLLYSPDYLFLLPGALFSSSGILGMFSIALYDIQIGKAHLGPNSMSFCCLLALLGIQIIFFGIIAKIFYSKSNPLFTLSNSMKRLISLFTLEIGILTGLLLALSGFFIDAIIAYRWVKVNFGDLSLSEIRFALMALVLLVVGIQIIFSTFLLSILKEK